jgi:hypothetical protein
LVFALGCGNDLGTVEGDAGEPDAGPDAGFDAGPRDAGTDGGPDAGVDAGVDAGPDAGTPNDGGPLPFVIDGGHLATLAFGLVGDTRPPIYDDTAGYPVQIIANIFQDLAQVSPSVAFVASTGDYMFADPLFGQSVPQAELYVDAGRLFPGPIFPSMGNHECGVALTSGNCFGQNTSDPNFEAYLNTILPGFGLSNANPYFLVIYDSADGSNPWNAKFIYLAPNAWDEAQNGWFADALAISTTYTFIVRHEPTSNAGGAPGVAPTDLLLQTNPFTLKLTGHSHSYSYDQSNQEVVNGLGGAALDTGYTGTFGYVICRQRSDNAIQCSQYDYDTNAISTEANSTFAITGAGASTPNQ